jgi:peptide/nickel transport system permease protein
VALVVARKLIYASAVLFAVTSLVFGLMRLSGDPLAGFLPPGSSPEQQATVRRQLGLDRPLVYQYGRFVQHALHGDFGTSWRGHQPALRLVMDRLPATLLLTAAAVVLALLVGVPIGVVAGTRPGGKIDAGATGFALLGQAMPGFWLGTLLILVFAVHLRWLPSSGASGVQALVLPALTLAAYPTATIARLLRASMIETMHHDYIRTARGKGLRPSAVVRVHALRNALLPVLAYVGLQVGFLIGGAVVVESVFAYPGVGRLALQAVVDRDLPVIQAFVVVIAAVIVALNLSVDLIAHLVDPRLRDAESLATGGSR